MLTRIQFDNIQDDTIRPGNLDIINPGSFGPNDIVTVSADGEHFEIIDNFGPDWVGLGLDALNDINLTGPLLDGQILSYDLPSGEWINELPAAAPTPVISLDDIVDVAESGSVDGHVLVFDSGTSQYVNRNVSYDELINVPLTFAPQAHSHSVSNINDWPFSNPPVSSDLADINLTGISVGEILVWNGVAFVPGSKATGVSVDSIFGRTGAVLAVSGDYGTNLITNESTITGVFLTDALNTINFALAAAPTMFVDLSDTPGSLTGNAGKIIAVNGAEDALEFVTTVGVDSVFGRVGTVISADNDYVSSQIDNNSGVLGGAGNVSDALNAVNFTANSKPGTFVELPDTPTSMTIGDANKILAVNAGGTAIEFIDPLASAVTAFNGRTGAVSPAISDYDASQVDNDSGVSGVFVSDALNTLNTVLGDKAEAFVDLTDTPAFFGGVDANKYVAVNGASTGLVFVTPPTIPVDSVYGRIGAVVSAASDYDASQVDNDSGVAGAFVDDALNTLNSTKADTGSVPASIGDLTDVDLTGLANTKILEWNTISSSFVVVDKPVSGAVGFTDLDDSPASYVGQGGKHVAVLLSETGIEFVDASGVASVHGRTGAVVSAASDYDASQVDNDSGVTGAFVDDALNTLNVALGNKADASSVPNAFTDLNDTPADFSGAGGKIIAVNAGGTALEYVDAVTGGAIAFLGLTDTPADYTGQANKLISVNGAANGIEFTVAPVETVHGRTGAVVSAASDYDASQVDNDSGVTGAFVSDALNTLSTALGNKPDTFVDLVDTPANIVAGDANKYVAVNGSGNGLAFITPPAIPTAVSDLTNDSGFISDITAESIDDLTDVDLTNIQDTYILEWDTPSGKFIAVAAPSAGAMIFSDLTDTPGSIEAGDADKYVVINGTGTGIVFLAPPLIPINVSDLSNDSGFISGITAEVIGDLSDVNTGGIQDTYILEWNIGTGTFIAVAPPAVGSTTFSGLTDTPASIVIGDANKYVAINGAGDALVFITPPAIPTAVSDLTNDSGFISDITAEDIGDLNDVNVAGILDGHILEWDIGTSKFVAVAPAIVGATAFTELTDTPANIVVGDANKYVAVNGAGNALAFITPPVIPTAVSDLTNDSGFISDITAENFGDLFDVNMAGVDDGFIIEWDAVTSKFVAVAPPGGAVVLEDLNDVTIINADIGDILRYNGSAWVDYPDSNFATNAQGILADSALQAVSDDLVPVLGGNLDVGGKSIVSATAGNIAITPDTTGSIVLDGLSWPQADGDPTYVLSTNGSGQLSWVAPGAAGATTFIELTDTPGTMVIGDANKYVAVNSGGTVLEFITPPVMPTNVSDLTNDSGFIADISAENLGDLFDVNVTGIQDTYILAWNIGTSKFITVPNVSATFVGLSDTPGTMVLGDAGKHLAVNSGGTALEYFTPSWLEAVLDDAAPQLGGDLNVNGQAIISATSVNITLTPGAGGDLVLDELKWPQADGTADYVLKTNGAGQLSWTPNSGAGSTTFVGLTDTPGDFTGHANKVVSVNGAGTALEFTTPAGAGTGFSTEWVKIPYTAGGFIDTGTGISSSTGITVAITANAVNTNLRISITFTGANGQTKPPSSIMSYGYVRGNNNYIVQPLDLTFGSGNAVLDPGGVAGSPGDILNSFATMTIDEIQVSTSATASSTNNPGEPPHAILILGW